MKRSIIACIALVLTFLLLVPEAGASRRGDGTRGTASRVRVRIVDNRFAPRSITIVRGTIVRWRNRGDNIHTTTSDDGLWDSGSLSPGEPFRRRFRRRGTFPYHCNIHANMDGTIRVTRA